MPMRKDTITVRDGGEVVGLIFSKSGLFIFYFHATRLLHQANMCALDRGERVQGGTRYVGNCTEDG